MNIINVSNILILLFFPNDCSMNKQFDFTQWRAFFYYVLFVCFPIENLIFSLVNSAIFRLKLLNQMLFIACAIFRVNDCCECQKFELCFQFVLGLFFFWNIVLLLSEWYQGMLFIELGILMKHDVTCFCIQFPFSPSSFLFLNTSAVIIYESNFLHYVRICGGIQSMCRYRHSVRLKWLFLSLNRIGMAFCELNALNATSVCKCKTPKTFQYVRTFKVLLAAIYF